MSHMALSHRHGALNATGLTWCSKIEPQTNFYGDDIQYPHRSNHWRPATMDECCRICHDMRDGGAPVNHPCQAWMWRQGTSGAPDAACSQGGDTGCCWLKRANPATKPIHGDGCFSGYLRTKAVPSSSSKRAAM